MGCDSNAVKRNLRKWSDTLSRATAGKGSVLQRNNAVSAGGIQGCEMAMLYLPHPTTLSFDQNDLPPI